MFNDMYIVLTPNFWMVMVKTGRLNIKLFVMETHLLGKSTQLQVDKNKKKKSRENVLNAKVKEYILKGQITILTQIHYAIFIPCTIFSVEWGIKTAKWSCYKIKLQQVAFICFKGDLLCKNHFYKVFEHSCVWKQPACNGKNSPTHCFII